MSIQAIVTDIEGTTSSISFVHDVLFPYARGRMPSFIHQHRDTSEVRLLLKEVSEEVGEKLSDDEIIQKLCQWIDKDKKIAPLKALQGLIWQSGYRNGDFRGHVYPDAYKNLKKWKEAGMAIYVYSSGSVKAQRLLFKYSDFGDITPFFDGYFDTHIGAKREVTAYRNITKSIALPAANILFLSDTRAELDAAMAAGMQAIQLVREATPEVVAVPPQVANFNGISID